jgi:phage terminase large subunit
VIKVKPNPLPKFKILYDLPPGTWLVINVGGRGGGKSYEVSKYAVLNATIERKRIALLRDQQSTIAQSIMHEIKLRYADLDEKAGGYFSGHWDMQDLGLKHRATGLMHIFSKGFKTAKNSQKAGLKSIADVDIAIVEEFEDIDDESRFNTFADGIRKKEALIIVN